LQKSCQSQISEVCTKHNFPGIERGLGQRSEKYIGSELLECWTIQIKNWINNRLMRSDSICSVRPTHHSREFNLRSVVMSFLSAPQLAKLPIGAAALPVLFYVFLELAQTPACANQTNAIQPFGFQSELCKDQIPHRI